MLYPLSYGDSTRNNTTCVNQSQDANRAVCETIFLYLYPFMRIFEFTKICPISVSLRSKTFSKIGIHYVNLRIYILHCINYAAFCGDREKAGIFMLQGGIYVQAIAISKSFTGTGAARSGGVRAAADGCSAGNHAAYPLRDARASAIHLAHAIQARGTRTRYRQLGATSGHANPNRARGERRNGG